MLAPQWKNISLQTIALCLVQTEMWLRSRFNSLVCLKGSNPSFGPCLSQQAEGVLEHWKDSLLFNSTFQRKYSLFTLSVSVLQLWHYW